MHASVHVWVPVCCAHVHLCVHVCALLPVSVCACACIIACVCVCMCVYVHGLCKKIRIFS